MSNWETKALTSALTGAETAPVNQAGVSKYTTINMIKAFISTAFEAAGSIVTAINAHLAAFTHGDIAHSNRAQLDLVLGANTGDQDLSSLAPKAAPALTGVPTAPTAGQGNSTTQLATTAFVLANAVKSYTGTVEPTTKYANMHWFNTTDNSIQQRNAANTAWVYKGPMDKEYDGVNTITVQFTGVWRYPYQVELLQPGALQRLDTSASVPAGKCIYDFTYTEGGVSIGQEITTLTLSDLIGVIGSFNARSLALVTSISMPTLSHIGVNFSPATFPVLTNLSTPLLSYIGGGYTPNTMNVLTTLSAQSLIAVGSNFAFGSMALLTTFNFPVLKSIGGFLNPYTMAALTTLSFPLLENIGGTVTIGGMGALTTISLPNLTYCADISISTGTPNITSITIGSTIKRIGGNVFISSAALTQVSVDHILARLAALNGTGGTTAYSGYTVTLTGTSATPSAAGLASKAILVGRGCTVTHN